MTFEEAVKLLKNAQIESAIEEVRILFSHYLKKPLYEFYGTNVETDCEDLIRALERRIQREPLDYILGTTCFFREEYIVSPACLIPRKETELLVEEAIQKIPQNGTFLDLCTGSGCISISLLNARKDLQGIAVDKSDEALACATQNLQKYNLENRLKLFKKDVLKENIEGLYDAILSNPPYIETAVLKTLEKELSFEPRMALDGGEDGLLFYRAILNKYLKTLKPQGMILFEIGYNQADALCTLAKNYGCSCEILLDYAQLPRIAYLKK